MTINLFFINLLRIVNSQHIGADDSGFFSDKANDERLHAYLAFAVFAAKGVSAQREDWRELDALC